MDTRLIIDPTKINNLSHHKKILLINYLEQQTPQVKWTGKVLEKNENIIFTHPILWRQKTHLSSLKTNVYYILGDELINEGNMNSGIYYIVGKLKINSEKKEIICYPISSPSKARLVKIEEIKFDLANKHFMDQLKDKKEQMNISEQVPHLHAHSFFYIKNGDTGVFYLKMKVFPGITLTEFLKNNKNIDLVTRLIIINQLLVELNLLHQSDIIHRDINPNNIIINPKTFEIFFIDFETAKVKGQYGREGYSPIYSAPEIIKAVIDKMGLKQINEKTDVFTVGLLLIELLGGPRRPKPLLIDDYASEKGTPAYWFDISILLDNWVRFTESEKELLKNMINSMTQLSPDARPLISEILSDIIKITINHLPNLIHTNVAFERYNAIISLPFTIHLPASSDSEWKNFWNNIIKIKKLLSKSQNAVLMPLLNCLPMIRTIGELNENNIHMIIVDYMNLEKKLLNTHERLKILILACQLSESESAIFIKLIEKMKIYNIQLQKIDENYHQDKNCHLIELERISKKINNLLNEIDICYKDESQKLLNLHPQTNNIINLYELLKKIENLPDTLNHIQYFLNNYISMNLVNHSFTNNNIITIEEILNQCKKTVSVDTLIQFVSKKISNESSSTFWKNSPKQKISEETIQSFYVPLLDVIQSAKKEPANDSTFATKGKSWL